MRKFTFAALALFALALVPALNVQLTVSNSFPTYKGAWLTAGKSCVGFYHNQATSGYEFVVYRDVNRADVIFGASSNGYVQIN